MGGCTSFFMNDLKSELEHSQLLYVAVCPLEAQVVIGEVAIVAIDAMRAKVIGSPYEVLVECGMTDPAEIPDEVSKAAAQRWDEILVDIKAGFEAWLSGDVDYEPGVREKAEKGLALFAKWFGHLWV